MPFTVSPFQGLWCYCYQISLFLSNVLIKIHPNRRGDCCEGKKTKQHKNEHLNSQVLSLEI